MIKFFRHIRRSLIQKNQMGKYFKYAIGEIILVVIGILIALQINNWNEGRKNKSTENEYYCRLHLDIVQDYIQIDNLIDKISKRQKYANQFLRLILQKNYDAQTLNLQYIKTIRGSVANFKPNKTTYEDIKSGGNLNLITDVSIKNGLDEYYKNIQPYTETIQQYINFATDSYNRLNINVRENGIAVAVVSTDSIGIPGYKFEPDILKMLEKDTVGNISEKLYNTYYDTAYKIASNMERRVQLLKYIKLEVEKTKQLLETKCNQVKAND
ncbi:DUF6090 family protein [Ichthyenterobacterium sp. W332]|uniref:DUF6090 family protein n=1 Tax=Microcosmobacter mediterraneus TaxID=3075607 RepID=A0ABU2YPA6_9FLAO|nr:DUF6090 family protein [Ichthyenterobacterium sp. W332]MDT0559635.1 DUF6090 family protein [Ichthyenterobacterium sp. W332]